MPISPKWHYICPITGTVVAQDITGVVEPPDAQALPDRWARIGGEVYSPEGMGILAHRILAHPDADYGALLTAVFPSTLYDDWQAT